MNILRRALLDIDCLLTESFKTHSNTKHRANGAEKQAMQYIIHVIGDAQERTLSFLDDLEDFVKHIKGVLKRRIDSSCRKQGISPSFQVYADMLGEDVADGLFGSRVFEKSLGGLRA